MSEADKMFEELGYKKNFEDKYRINYENKGYETIINFDKDIKEIRIWNNGININAKDMYIIKNKSMEENYISKDKIRERIRELEKDKENNSDFATIQAIILDLENLLEED